jgi:hypothetical protein
MVCLKSISVDTLHTGDTEDNNNNNNNNNNNVLITTEWCKLTRTLTFFILCIMMNCFYYDLLHCKKCWCQLPEFGEIVAPKHVGAIRKIVFINQGYAVAQLDESLRYKLEGLGFNTR